MCDSHTEVIGYIQSEVGNEVDNLVSLVVDRTYDAAELSGTLSFPGALSSCS